MTNRCSQIRFTPVNWHSRSASSKRIEYSVFDWLAGLAACQTKRAGRGANEVSPHCRRSGRRKVSGRCLKVLSFPESHLIRVGILMNRLAVYDDNIQNFQKQTTSYWNLP
jgi:hypothetical protein